ncbi:MAG: protein phosphatase 2C domain-containing protein [Pseudomonadota bacterium]
MAERTRRAQAPFVSDHESDGLYLAADVGGGAAVAFTRQSPDKTSGNEDTLGLFPYGPDAAVLAVADGAGGLPAGQRASRTAIRTLGESLARYSDETRILRSAVLNGIEDANLAILDQANGSATTLTVVTVEGRTLRTYHVGDSLALVTGQRGLRKLQTVAHSPVGFAVEAGFLSERDALFHIDRHVVSNFLGTPEMRIDVGAEIDLAARDTVILSSDGLSDNLHVEEIVDAARTGPLPAAAHRLVAGATRRMREPAVSFPSKPDDLSLVLFRKVPSRKAKS